MNRGFGIGGVFNTIEKKSRFKEYGDNLKTLNYHRMLEDLEIFKINLKRIALKYKDQINKDAELRFYFNELCNKIGVDPLLSNKDFWSDFFGIGDFYYELAVHLIEICMNTRPINGGFLEIKEALFLLQDKKNNNTIREDDILRSLETIKVLGNGFDILKIGEKTIIRSVPYELDPDQTQILILAQQQSYITVSELLKEFGYYAIRAQLLLEKLIQQGIAWLDNSPGEVEKKYWIPSIFFSNTMNR